MSSVRADGRSTLLVSRQAGRYNAHVPRSAGDGKSSRNDKPLCATAILPNSASTALTCLIS